MAEDSPIAKPELGCKSVQELTKNGDDKVLHKYIWRDTNNYGPIDLSLPLNTEIPVIDVSQLISSSSTTASAMDAQLQKLRSALSSWGCFQAINHGIENSFLDEVRELSRKFFHLPMMEKHKYVKSVDGNEGYGNDMVLFNDHSLDWNDRLYLLVSPEDQCKLEYWPQNPENFRNMLNEYTNRLRHMQELLLESIARSLSLPESCFLNQFGKRPTMHARFNYYPLCSRPDLVLGLRPHSDGAGITIFLQDKEVEGLQLLKDEKWFQVPIIPHALLVNVGDQLEIMSNGIVKSPVHRALTNSWRERNTLAMFFAPDPEMEIEPVEELVDDKRPRLYKKITNYRETYVQHYQQGKRSIDAVKI